MKFSRKQLISLIGILTTLIFFPLVQQRREAIASPSVEQYGVAGGHLSGETEDERRHLLELLKQTGTKWVRLPLSWKSTQPQKGVWNWEEHDNVFSLLKEAEIEPLVLLVGTPAWASRDGTEGDTPPKNLADFENFVKEATKRYGYQEGGKKQIRYWEIWNEPDVTKFTPGDYHNLLKSGYNSVKSVDPNATVLFGAMGNRVVLGKILPGCDLKCQQFLPKLLSFADIGNYFDIFNIHVYGQHHSENPEFTINKAKNLLAQNNLSHKPIWVTETNPDKETEDEQVAVLSSWFKRTFAAGVEKAFYFPEIGAKRNRVLYLSPDFTPTKVLPAFQQMVGMIRTINLMAGWNQITWSDVSGYTAKTALEDIDSDCGAGTALTAARKRKDWWEDFVKNLGGEIFNLQTNQNYFINVNKGCTWNP